LKPVLIIAIAVVCSVVAVFVVLIVLLPVAECSQQIRDHIEKYTNECPDNFKEFGYDSADRCYEQEIALFDPAPCL